MALQISLLACLLAVTTALLPCQTRLTASRVAAPRLAWAVAMCDAGEAVVPEPAAEPVALAEPAAEPAAALAEPAAAPAAAAPRPRGGAKLSIEELVVGTMVEGTVRSVQSYGAFIDIGYATDGLLHVSEMSDTFVKDANDMFSQGDTVTVRVKAVDTAKNQVALSNKDPNAKQAAPRGSRRDNVDMTEFENADEKVYVTGKVRSIQSFGAFVNLKDGVDGLLHISEIMDGGVKSVADVLSEGQEVQVRVVSFDKQRRIGLSMKPWVELTEEEKAEKAAGRRPRRGGGGRGGGFDDDGPFKMEPADIANLTLEYEEAPASPFAAALSRAEMVKDTKAAKQRYAAVVL